MSVCGKRNSCQSFFHHILLHVLDQHGPIAPALMRLLHEQLLHIHLAARPPRLFPCKKASENLTVFDHDISDKFCHAEKVRQVFDRCGLFPAVLPQIIIVYTAQNIRADRNISPSDFSYHVFSPIPLWWWRTPGYRYYPDPRIARWNAYRFS